MKEKHVVILHLEQDEIDYLYAISNHIGGNPYNSRRKVFSSTNNSFYSKLRPLISKKAKGLCAGDICFTNDR